MKKLNIEKKLTYFKSHTYWGIEACYWYITKLNECKKLLKNNYNIQNLKAHSMFQWHLGWKYFTGTMEYKKEVFIKIGTEYNQINNEIYALVTLKSLGITWIPQIYAYTSTKYFALVAMEMVKGITLEKFMLYHQFNEKQKDSLILGFIEIAVKLGELEIIHRDIRPANIILKQITSHNINVILIDFATCIFKDKTLIKKGQELEHKYLKGLGGGLNPSAYTWDDAYSLCAILKQIDDRITEKKMWKKLSERIGELSYTHKDKN